MKKIIITAIIPVFIATMVSSNSKQANIKPLNINITHTAMNYFLKDIGSAD